jgi:hypothetical protein
MRKMNCSAFLNAYIDKISQNFEELSIFNHSMQEENIGWKCTKWDVVPFFLFFFLDAYYN